MTDSMKFGPEWLRNLSSDSSVSSNTNSGTTSNSGGNFNQNSLTHVPATRNMFPEFRYGREEMLSLFDKNCESPEILPIYKKIYVEKVQFPLALTPSTDEEVILQSPHVPAQRPSWVRRSPVGFANPTRGTSRGGGSMDRGRMRGKPGFSLYQRPVVMYEDGVPKPERSWSERNGAPEVLNLSSAANVGSGNDWNGTPGSSPRKEYSSHSRNVENWRKNRNGDNVGDTSSAGGGVAPVPSDGWRTNAAGTGFNSSHQRWGRSTSWRDDDFTPTGTESGFGSGNVVAMQRSYSTISTDRGAYNNLSKTASNSSMNFSSNPQLSRPGHLNNSFSASQLSLKTNKSIQKTIEGEDILPEWAMENPLDGGGTFDASGAFHGSGYYVDEAQESKIIDDAKNSEKNLQSKQRDNSTTASENSNRKENISSDIHDTDSKSTIKEPHLKKSKQNKNELEWDENTSIEKTDNISAVVQSKNLENNMNFTETNDNEKILNDSKESMVSTHFNQSNSQDHSGVANDSLGEDKQLTQMCYESSQVDYSDRMKKVADDMIEKLIMDDDIEKARENNNHADGIADVAIISNEMNVANEFVSPEVMEALLKQNPPLQLQNTQRNVAVSPTLATLTDKTTPLFGGGIVIDRATMHHMQQQLTAANISPANIPLQVVGGTPTGAALNDMWYYRDPQSKVQGPFSAIEMTEWYRAGYFNENLYVRRVCDTRFRSLGELLKMCHGKMPFTHSHLLPMSLDNIPHVSNPPTPLNDFISPQLQKDHHEELKNNVTAAANSLCAAMKNLNSVDMSHVITMHFQLLQEQYLRHQEMIIVGELSKTEFFQRLTAQERESLVRQKVQLICIPDHLTNLAGLSNTLASLNPTVANQLFETINECSKKNVYSGGLLPPSNAFMESDVFLNSSHAQHQPRLNVNKDGFEAATVNDNGRNIPNLNKGATNLPESKLFNDFNYQMNPSEAINQQHQHQHQQITVQQKSHDFAGVANEFLREQQQMLTSTQTPTIQMWSPQIVNNIAPRSLSNPQILAQETIQMQNNQWIRSGPLVGLTNLRTNAAGIPSGTPDEVCPNNWNPNLTISEGDITHQQQEIIEKCEIEAFSIPEDKMQGQNTELNKNTIEENKNDIVAVAEPISFSKTPSSVIKTGKEEISEKQQFHKRISNRSVATNKPKEEEIANSKKLEEDRRRELAETKRRQKEDKKRQQLEEEKRKAQNEEDEKNRRMQEERERQQSIQIQRRKAMLGNNANFQSGLTTEQQTGKTAKEQHEQSHTQSFSIAPWSAQTMASGAKTALGLAEIQKAERRERRADQQRQMEILEKQMRTVATSEPAVESISKWNPSLSLPVKSLAEIQAEETKRLAQEMMEQQRRKDQDQLVTAVANSGNSSSSNISSIWGSNKVWCGSSTTSGLWEEPIKSNTTSAINNPNTTIANVIVGYGNSTENRNNKQLEQKIPNTSLAHNASSMTASRGLKKSQTVSVMQNSGQPGFGGNNKNAQLTSNAKQPIKKQKAETERKSNSKQQSNVTFSAANASGNLTANKKNDYESEFTNWCTKVLNNMSAKVDVPTFVSFLQDLESPFEVKDYIRMYLGESKEYTDFAKQFLERRSKYKNMQRAQNAHNDDMCKPAPAITPSGNDNSENKGKQKKIKKSKMTKLDARILGFSVTAAEGRINVGDRDYVDGP